MGDIFLELEPPNKRRQRKDGTTGQYATLANAEWARLMAESLRGGNDNELAIKYGVSVNTVRQRRYNDSAWRVAHDRLKEMEKAGGKKEAEKALTSPLTVAEIASLNPELIANFTYNALKVAIDQGLLPLPSSWSEAKTAMDMMWKATGQDKAVTNVQVSLWSGASGSASQAPSIAVDVEIVSQEAQEDWI